MNIKHKHRKETFWQIITPLIISALIMVAVAVFVVILTFRETSGEFSEKWGSISFIYLSLPAILVALVLLTLLIGSIYLVGKFYRLLPGYASSVYAFLLDINRLVNNVSDKLVKPIIFTNSKLTGISVLYKKTPEEITRSPGTM